MKKSLYFTDYDYFFIEATKIHLQSFDWRFLKAQAFQESRFDPDAISPVGAMGVMQIMPKTWEQGKAQKWAIGNPYNAEDSIYAGAYYMGYLIGQWKSKRPAIDRFALALASYNAGIGNILKAQAEKGGSNLYSDIISGLPDITGVHSKETIQYVKRIFGYYSDLVLGYV
jgi:soluble lytic murein transglycosylase-like protein